MYDTTLLAIGQQEYEEHSTRSTGTIRDEMGWGEMIS